LSGNVRENEFCKVVGTLSADLLSCGVCVLLRVTYCECRRKGRYTGPSWRSTSMITTTGNRSASSCLNASWSSLRLATHHQVEPPGQTELVILAEVILCSLSYLLLGRQEGLSLPQSSDISRACSCVVAQSTDCWTGLVNNRLRVDDFRPGAAAQCSWASWTVYNIC